MGVTASLLQRWWGRTTAAIALTALLAVVLAQTGIVSQGAPPPDDTMPVGAPAGPATSAPAAERQVQAPAAAPAPAPAVADVVAAVRRSPVARATRYPGALLDVPDKTVAAYQRAAAIINATADCHLDWLTLAAIARIESNHGRGPGRGHRVNRHGVVKPSLVGRLLNGKAGRGVVDDTDAGKVDGNKRWDAPVGPFGLLPATWASVAVDADGNDVRNPQDVDDAALGAAVVLCAGGHDLARPRALRKALRAYHPTRGFAATVLALTERYAEEMESVPVFMSAPGLLAIPDDLAEICDCARKQDKPGREAPATPEDLAGPGPSDGPSEDPSDSGGTPPPTDPGTPDNGGTVDPGDPGTPVEPPAEPDPVEPPAEPDPVEPPAEPDPVVPSTEPEPAPEPVDPPPAAPDSSADRVATGEPEPVPEPVPAPEPDPEAATEPETAAAADAPAAEG